MSETTDNRDALTAAILTSINRWRDQLDQSDLHCADCEQLLSEFSAEESFRILELGNSAADQIERSPEAAVDITMRLATSNCEAARAVGCVLIAHIGKFNPRTWIALIKHLADDENSGVRDTVPMIFDLRPEIAGWVEMHEEYVFAILEEFRSDSNYRVRRVAARALTGFAAQSVTNAERVLKFLLPLLSDAAEFVRRNLVSALREIGRSQPDVILAFLETRAQNSTVYDRELIPLVLEAAFARKHAVRRDAILARL